VCSREVIFFGGLLLCGTAIALCGLVWSQLGVVICAATAGLLLGAGNPLEQTILQEVTPRAIAGQVFTSLGAIRFIAGPLGLLIGGFSTEHFGAQPVLVVGGVFLAVTALLGWQFGSLRNSKPSQRG
jgi:MFS family permease